MPDDEKKIIAALENPKYDWRTVEGICQETGISSEAVLEWIKRMEDIVVQSSIPDKKGQNLYTTRKHFARLSNIVSRSLSAATGSIRK